MEESQDADKVLDIFVRVNSGGTTLSYSDLLLSMATNQWQQLDAREEVRGLVQELNTGGSRTFDFSKDVVLKTALMVAGVDMRFRVTNFTRDNMLRVEASWERTRAALVRAATLLSRFGFSGRTLTAHSVVIPIAYYLAVHDLGDSYIDSTAAARDRETMRRWVNRSLMKRGIWGSGLDTTLTRIRAAIDAVPTSGTGVPGFPVEDIQRELAAIGKSLHFEETEVDELLELKYGGQRTFPVLAMLYPGLDFSKEFHEDHIFPRSRFTPARLLQAGVPSEDVDAFRLAVDRLPNLQLLEGAPNVEKQAQLPATWLTRAFPSTERRDHYVVQHDLTGLPEDITEFTTFFEARKARLRGRLLRELGFPQSAGSGEPPAGLRA